MKTLFIDGWQRKSRFIAIGTVALAVVALASSGMLSRPPDVPTAAVKRGEFIDYLPLRGEVKARKSITVSAPYSAGTLQILHIVQDGTPVKKGDVLVEFDSTRTKQDLAQYRSALQSASAEIDQSRAQAGLKQEADVTAVSQARYDMERAKLDASKQEIVSAIEGAQAQIKVSDAEQKLRENEAKLRADGAASAATIAGKIKAKEKGAYDVRQAESGLAALTLRAPAAGLATILSHWTPDDRRLPYRAGDQAWPGSAIVELPDLSSLMLSGRVDEIERGRVKEGQRVSIRLDAIPDREFSGHITAISPIASVDFSGGWPPPRNFTAEVSIDQTDPRLKPGMSAGGRVEMARIPDAVVVPAQATFQKSGRTVVYVLDGKKFHEQPIEAGRRSGDQLMVAHGLKAGVRVALKDPTSKE